MDYSQSLSKLSRLKQFHTVDSENVNIIVDIAYLNFDLGNIDEAEDYFRKGFSFDPNNSDLIFINGLIRTTKKEYAEALSLFNRVFELGVRNANLYYQSAYCYLQTGSPEKALSLLDDASTLSQDDQIVLLFGRTQYQLGDYSSAIKTVTPLCDNSPICASACGLMSQIHLDNEEWDQAQHFAAKAMKLDATNQPGAITLGFVDLRSKSYDRASEQFEKALLVKEDSARTHLGLAIANMFLGQHLKSEDHLRRVLTLQPDCLPAINLLGWLHILLDRFVEARETFESGLKIDRSYGEMYGGLAVIDVISGEHGQARQQISKSLRLNRQSYAGNFAKVLMLSDDETQYSQAEKVWNNLMSSPSGEDGKTMEEAIIGQIKEYLKMTIH